MTETARYRPILHLIVAVVAARSALVFVPEAGAAEADARAELHEVAAEEPEHGEDGAPGDAQAAVHGEEHGGPEKKMLLELPEFLPNFLSFVTFNPELHGNEIVGWLHYYAYENLSFALLSALIFIGLARYCSHVRSDTEVPNRRQSFLEMIVEGLDNLVCGVLGPRGRRYTPFIGCVFLYIWLMNMQGLVPGLKSPTSYLGVTLGMGFAVFFYVQYVGIRENGIGGYLLHLAGSPTDLVGWLMAPLMLVLHVVGELVKPVSLSLRLFGNIMGEDCLIGVFALLGIVLLSVMAGGPTTLDSMMGLEAQATATLASWQWFGIPLQLPFMMLALLTGTIQALVFALLSTIYIFLMLPHDEHEHGEGGEHEARPEAAAA